ncbi:hypothetical protein OOK31_00495 [Streptomyces sp. NBC_00249]|uniref:DUF7224 domain-containing protein n=1 Tax=Streptomyces sp. NBC_00249 TaxID=2975690 RepID=UPI00225329EB|nr:hypothetical protein [Streptomyces sp. NBC_00249]MCX5192379.1 hypothetical protein [Streptomyces sp. NBC_00249]
MRIATLLRSSSAGLMLVFLAGYVLLLLSEPITMGTVPGYGPSVLGNASYTIPFAAAACAASGAWESARLRRGNVFGQAPSRSRLAIALPLLVPVWAMGVVGMLIAVAVAVSAAGTFPPFSHLGMFVVYALLMAAATLAGYLLGGRLPHLAAAPLAMIAGFCLTAFPGSWDTPWPRHLVAGAYDSCCSVGSVIDPVAVWAPLLFAGGIITACLLAIARAGRWKSLAVLVAASVASVFLVVDMDYDPVADRNPDALVCDTAGVPEVCLWPETPGRTRVTATTRTYSGRLKDAGLPMVSSLTQNRELKPGQAGFGGKGQVREQDITANLANTLLPPIPECARISHKYPAYPARGPLTAWLTAIATQAAPAPVQGRVSPDDAKLAQKVLTLPSERQRAWYEANRAALTGCDQKPALNPEGAGR